MPSDIPESFRPMRIVIGFLQANGPLYGKFEDGRVILGFRVEPRHCNPGNVAHGGMLATYADMLLPIASRYQSDREMGFMPTVNLTCDYLAPAPVGSWVEGRAEPVRITKNLVFAQGVATADGMPCLRANGIFKIVPSTQAPFTFDTLFGE